MSFHPGQRVVCVDASNTGKYVPWKPLAGYPLQLVKSRVYTIREIGEFFGLPTVWLDEITRQPFRGVEPGFDPRRFRPVKTTSIEIFRQMLVTPPKETVDA